MVDVFRKRKLELLFLTETKLKGNLVALVVFREVIILEESQLGELKWR